jgi:hypothetical protein
MDFYGADVQPTSLEAVCHFHLRQAPVLSYRCIYPLKQIYSLNMIAAIKKIF